MSTELDADEVGDEVGVWVRGCWVSAVGERVRSVCRRG